MGQGFWGFRRPWACPCGLFLWVWDHLSATLRDSVEPALATMMKTHIGRARGPGPSSRKPATRVCPLATTLKHTGTQRSQTGGLRRAAVPKEGNTSCGAHLLRGPGHLPKGLRPQGLVKDHSAPSCSWPWMHPPGLESHLDIAQAHTTTTFSAPRGGLCLSPQRPPPSQAWHKAELSSGGGEKQPWAEGQQSITKSWDHGQPRRPRSAPGCSGHPRH